MYLITSSILAVLQPSMDRTADCCLTSAALSTSKRVSLSRTHLVSFPVAPFFSLRLSCLVRRTNLKGRPKLGQVCTLYIAAFLHSAFSDIYNVVLEYKALLRLSIRGTLLTLSLLITCLKI